MSNPQNKLWKPQRGSQMAFHQAMEVDELLYGGAAGGGKSQSLVTESCRYIDYSDYRGIIFRRTYPEIEKSLVPVAYEIFSGRAKPKNRGMEWTFHSGAKIYLSHMQYEEDKEKHKSSEYDYIGFDELTSFTEPQYIYLFTRLRGKNKNIKRHIRAATNPTGPGHSWVKDRFLDPHLNDPNQEVYGDYDYEFACGWRTVDNKVHTSFGTLPDGYEKGHPEFSREKFDVYKDKKSGLLRAFIPALLWGNSILLKGDPDYKKRMMAQPEKTQQALLYGSWNLFEGQFFSEWDPDKHVIEPITIPSSWRKFVAIDYGYSAPFCALWFALDGEGTLYCYRELYATKMITSDQAETILTLTRAGEERVEWYTADPSMFSRQGTGESHADAYSRAGLHLTPSSNKRVAGWALVHDYLTSGKLKIFSSCKNICRTLPTLAHSKTNPDDLNTRQEDHAADALRYMLLTLKGLVTTIKDEPTDGVPEWFKKIKKKKRKGYRRGGF